MEHNIISVDYFLTARVLANASAVSQPLVINLYFAIAPLAYSFTAIVSVRCLRSSSLDHGLLCRCDLVTPVCVYVLLVLVGKFVTRPWRFKLACGMCVCVYLVRSYIVEQPFLI